MGQPLPPDRAAPRLHQGYLPLPECDIGFQLQLEIVRSAPCCIPHVHFGDKIAYPIKSRHFAY